MHGAPTTLDDMDRWFEQHGIPTKQRKGQPPPDVLHF